MDFQAEFEKNKESILKDYFHFLKFKSIATDPLFKEDVVACADWVCDFLKGLTLQIEKWETGGAPTIFAQDLRAGPDKKTVLLYCHYDVQPVDPLNKWSSPPFKPVLRNGQVYARGACDNKGQCFYTMLALKTVLPTMETPPINIKLIIEGEEESGSCGLANILQRKKEALKADYLIIVDSGIDSLETPAITLGARGLLSMEITLKEAAFDLHSGSLGGAAYNPNRALANLIHSFHDQNGQVTIQGFYDNITPLSEVEKKEISFDFDPNQFQKTFGFNPSGMEKGYSAKEALWLRPTLEINGMWGGYTGSGFKTVIPAESHAKISCRLVPNQNPETIIESLKQHIYDHIPSTMEVEIKVFAGHSRGFRTHPHSPIVTLMERCYSEIFQKPCQKILIGGSIPIAVDLAEAAQAQMVLVGLGLPDDHIHAPDEHFGLNRLEKGYLTICRAIELFHQLPV